MDLHGHYWTVAPRLRHLLRPLAAPASRPWETWVEDPVAGRVRLTGRLAQAGGAREGAPAGGELLLVVHGLGGSTESHTAVRAARAAAAVGLACLRLNLRGSDRLGDDFYHAALTADLHAALASPELAAYGRIYVLGWSLGGHLALRLAAEEADPRLAAVAAVCAPLDLAASVEAIDRPALWAYRRSVLGGLKEIYAACAARRAVALPVREAASIGRLREWDDRVVAPRHGFAGAADYYARASVAPLLPRLRLPALLLAAEHDPMVPASALRPTLERLERDGGAGRLELRWLAVGGHCGFPRRTRLEAAVIDWLQRHG
jgi:predicted alpha/beta-fold hydrolase